MDRQPDKLRVLVAHNYYQQPGGEDNVVAAETELLQQHGHQVTSYFLHNDLAPKMFPLALAGRTIWSQDTYRDFQVVLQQTKPHLVHFHNIFPLISPAAYYAAASEGVPVVQTLHNYRLLCPSAHMFRNGHPCFDCVGRNFAWPAIRHSCYRSSTAATVTIAAMLSVHNTVDTWSDSVDLYICPSEAMRQHFIGGGFPPRRLVVKPHFICEVKPPAEPKGNYLLFAGRLTREKGILTLLDACRTAGPRCRLKIAGDGPLAPEVRDFVRRHHWAEWVGHVGACQMKSLIAGANAVVIPSEWEEPFGLIAIEAFSFGTPVIASRVGALPEIVDHLRTGLLFTPHHARELAAHMSWVFDHPVEVGSMARMACVEAGTTYAAETNYAQLIAAYERAVCRPDSASLTPPTLSTRVATPEVLSNALLSH